MTTKMITMNNGKNAKGMAEAIQDYMTTAEKMDTQILTMADGGYIVQGKSHNGFRALVGMKKAITAKISMADDGTARLEVGEGKWADKAIATTVSLFVLWPLAVTSMVGSVQQAKLPGNIIRAAEAYAA